MKKMKSNKNKYYLEEIKLLLNTVPHHLKVQFALFCAKDARQYANPKDLEVIDKTITLVEQWLKDKDTVTEQELRDAAHAHAYAADAASYAAADVYAAAYGYTAADAAADAAAYAAYTAAASYAAYADTAAAYTASSAANKEEKFKYYFDYLATLIAKMTKIEKIVYGLV